MQGRLNAIYKKLNNPNFVKRAPEDVVANEKNKKLNYENILEKLKNNLQSLEE